MGKERGALVSGCDDDEMGMRWDLDGDILHDQSIVDV
jgi:hypothetical protein